MAQATTRKQPFLEDVVRVPVDVSVEVRPPARVMAKGRLGSLEKDFSHAGVELGMDGDSVRVRVYGRGRRGLARLGTVKALLRNMFIGVTQGYTYRMKIVQSHFPMNVRVHGNTLIIENFAGERHPRTVAIPEGVKVQVKGDEVVVSGVDKYLVGLTAGRIENEVRISGKDPRKFLDGIYVYEKSVGMA